MNYEKKYSDALDWMRKIYPTLTGANKEDTEHYFPELKESEDERIRTRLIALVEAFGQGKYKDEMLSYLERQKDQDVKVISWREPDDCADIPEGHYVVIAYKPGVFGLGYIGNGKVVCAPGQKPSGILYIPNADESIIVESKEQKSAEWSEFDKGALKDAICAADRLGNDESFKKSNPNLAKAFRVAKDWLKSLPERFTLQPEQEVVDRTVFDRIADILRWCDLPIGCPIEDFKQSESEREHLLHIVQCVAHRYANSCTYCKEYSRGYQDGLAMPHWKPYKEQLSALEYFIRSWGESGTMSPQNPTLCAAKTLLNDLKKL